MENNKYYVPTIDEFYHVFEYYTPMHSSDELIKCVFNINKTPNYSWNKDDSGNISYPENFFKVKYLDQEDIENLGFKQIPDSNSYELGDFQIYFQDEAFLQVYNFDSQIIFEGGVKNKSELKKLLKQLNIE